MNQQIKAKWVAALRSGKYKQGRGKLGFKRKDEYRCCLGVLCEVAKQDGVIEAFNKSKAWLPDEVMAWAGVIHPWGGSVEIKNALTDLDDHNDHGRTFAEIADAIEAQL